MSILAGIKAFMGGGTGKEIVGFIRDRFPAKLSEAEMMQLQQAADEMDRAHETKLLEFAQKQDESFNERTILMEGTAKDLQQFGFLGKIVVFLRGLFRPTFAYFTMYLDFLWFTGDTTGWTDQQNTAMIVINIIVLVFFFG
ncbi:MAG: hypothetical protein ACR2PR_01740, partial [Pseudohongiellaceae bacterium]